MDEPASRPETSVPSLAEAVVESSLDGCAVMDREARYTLWNPAMEQFTGKTAAEVLGRHVFEVFPFLRALGFAQSFERALAGEVVTTEGLEQVGPDGTRRVYDGVHLPLRSGRGEITGVIGILRDATARHDTQEALRRSEAKLRMAAESAGIGLWSWNPATDVVQWEDAMCTIFGLAPGEAPRTRDAYMTLVHPEDRAAAERRVSRGSQEWESEYRIVRPDGTVRWVVSKARVIRSDGKEMVLGATFDVTERRARDEGLRASQRLEAIGQLTAGIAHNFNNILMGLLPNLELAARLAPAELVPLLREAAHSGERAANVVRQLMTYAGRNQKSARRVEAIGPLVERTVAFCRTTFDKGIALDVHCGDRALAAVDASQLEQALLNPLINARDALESRPHGAPCIVVVVETIAPGSPELEGRPGPWVCVRVTDNGVGMDVATVQRVFEPFFTTKEAGKGTGLGLATTQGIVRDHDGFVTCRSEPGRGTTVAMYLPAIPVERIAPEPAHSTAPPPRIHDGARATILLVDDEEPIRRIVARVLRESDFDVETAASGEDAIARIADASVAARISAVLLDVSMPGMSGPQLRVRLRDLLPHARVVFLTGYPYQAGGEDTVLDKPLSGDKLVSTLRNLLATP